MSLKLKALGLGLIAALAMSAVGVMNASATSTGHFYSHFTGKTKLIGSEGGTHFTELTSHGLEGGIVCDEVSYESTIETTSVHLEVKPIYKKCHTTGAAADTTTVTMNGCSYTFTPGHVGTVHLDCEPGKAVEIHHPNCTITIAAQTVSGVTYTQEGGAIILDANTVQFNSQYHGGICIFTGTSHTGTLHGSVTVKGFENGTENQVSITHTAT